MWTPSLITPRACLSKDATCVKLSLSQNTHTRPGTPGGQTTPDHHAAASGQVVARTRTQLRTRKGVQGFLGLCTRHPGWKARDRPFVRLSEQVHLVALRETEHTHGSDNHSRPTQVSEREQAFCTRSHQRRMQHERGSEERPAPDQHVRGEGSACDSKPHGLLELRAVLPGVCGSDVLPTRHKARGSNGYRLPVLAASASR